MGTLHQAGTSGDGMAAQPPGWITMDGIATGIVGIDRSSPGARVHFDLVRPGYASVRGTVDTAGWTGSAVARLLEEVAARLTVEGAATVRDAAGRPVAASACVTLSGRWNPARRNHFVAYSAAFRD